MSVTYISTPHGTINTILRRYATIRKPEHYFIKYGGFGISTSEINEINKHGANHIIIRYEGTRQNIIYIISLERLLMTGQTYDHKGDEQIIIPKDELNIIGIEKK